MSTLNPMSIPGGWKKDTPRETPRDTPAQERSNPAEAIPRSATGLVSDSGEIIDHEGRTIGKLNESEDARSLVGNTVTATGDVVNEAGEKLGRASLDDKEIEYTTGKQDTKESPKTQEEEEKSTGGGFFSSASSLVKGLGGSFSRSKKNIESEAGQEAIPDVPEAGATATATADKSDVVQSQAARSGAGLEEVTSKAPTDLKDVPPEPVSESHTEAGESLKSGQPPQSAGAPSETPLDEKRTEAGESLKGTESLAPENSASQVGLAPEAPEDEKRAEAGECLKGAESLAPENSVSQVGLAPEVPADEKLTEAGESLKSGASKIAPSQEAGAPSETPGDDLGTEAGESLKSGASKVAPSLDAGAPEVPGDDLGTEAGESLKSGASKVAPSQSAGAPSEAPEGSQAGEKSQRDAGSEAPNLPLEPGDATSQIPDERLTEAGESQVEGSRAGPVILEDREQEDDEKTVGAKTDVSADKSQVAGTEVPETIGGEEQAQDESQKEEAQELPETIGGEEQAQDESQKEEAQEEEEGQKLDYTILKGAKVNKVGNLVDDKGDMVGRVVEGKVKQILGKKSDEEGNIWNDAGKIVGKAEPISQAERDDQKDFAPFENFPDAVVESDGRVTSQGVQVGIVVEGDPKRLNGSKVDEDGDILDRNGNVVGKAEPKEKEELVEEEPEKADTTSLKGAKVNKVGNLVDSKGEVVGRVVEGNVKQLQGKICDENGDIWDSSGKIIGKGEPISSGDRDEQKDFAPFENFPNAIVEADGTVTSDGKQVGTVVQGDPKRLKGSKVDEDGDILDRNGNVVGKAEPWDKPEKDDTSSLKGAKVNKLGKLVDSRGEVVGRVVEGNVKQLEGRTCDENGDIWDSSGKIIGKGEPLSTGDRDEQKSFAPFENFPNAIVEGDGRVTSDGQQVGTVVQGDPKRLKGSKVDEDGDILDRNGNVVGKAEPWDEPEAEAEQVIDRSCLAGKRVNKRGNVVDSSGVIYGRVIEGNVAALVGRMCDKEGNVRSESGDVIGKAEIVSEGEREGSKDGPFAELSGLTVSKDGKVVTPSGDVVGRLISGDPKILCGRSVDEDGDVTDRNGNVLGKAERWEEAEVEKKKDPLAGRTVNREGNVVDEEGNIIGKLVSGDLQICSGKEVDDDGDVVNSKGHTIGHVSLLANIPPEPEHVETEEERQAREEEARVKAEEAKTKEEEERDRKLAGQLGGMIEQSLDKIKPLCNLITAKIDSAERTPKEDLDEEQLVREVKPLIEEGGKILSECNGMIRGLDPDGRIQRQAKAKAGTKEASPEEHHLAEQLKELTGTVTQTIDNAKRKIEGMPHAKKELNPLWGLLMEPLGQILAAVGLLLNGVLGLVGKLLSGLGLGPLVDHILGGLGLNKILGSLGLGQAYDALVGKDKKKEGGGGKKVLGLF